MPIKVIFPVSTDLLQQKIDRGRMRFGRLAGSPAGLTECGLAKAVFLKADCHRNIRAPHVA
jgi:hypothetical protein